MGSNVCPCRDRQPSPSGPPSPRRRRVSGVSCPSGCPLARRPSRHAPPVHCRNQHTSPRWGSSGDLEHDPNLGRRNQIHDPEHPHEGYPRFVHFDERHQASRAEGVRDSELVRPQNGPRSTISGLRGVRVGSQAGFAERTTVVLSVGETGDHEAGQLARDGPVEAVPGDARRGVSGGSAEGWLTHVTVEQPADPVLNTGGWQGGLRSPVTPLDFRHRWWGGGGREPPPEPPPRPSRRLLSDGRVEQRSLPPLAHLVFRPTARVSLRAVPVKLSSSIPVTLPFSSNVTAVGPV